MRLHAIVSDLATAQAAVEGGATVIQLRLKGASTEQVVAAGAAFRELDTTFVVNDDVQAAIALGADGVHLGRDDPGAEAAIAAGLLLGTSASSVDEAKAGRGSRGGLHRGRPGLGDAHEAGRRFAHRSRRAGRDLRRGLDSRDRDRRNRRRQRGRVHRRGRLRGRSRARSRRRKGSQ